MAIAGLLLAAGESTRMGTLKALLEWEGTSLLEYQVVQLRAAKLGEIVVVLGHEAERLRPLLDDPHPSPLPEGEGTPSPSGGTPHSRCRQSPPPTGALSSPHSSPEGEGAGRPSSSVESVAESVDSSVRQEEIGRVRAVYNPDYRVGKTSSIRMGVAALSADATGVLILGVDQPRPRCLLDYLIERHAAALLSVPVHAGRRGHPPIFARALFPELLALSEEREGLREVLRAHASEINLIGVDSPIIHLNLNRPEDYAAARR